MTMVSEAARAGKGRARGDIIASAEYPEVARVAFDALKAGISVVPPTEDGKKRPIGEWKAFQAEPPKESHLARWYGHHSGLGFVCGAVSGGLELFEFDEDLYGEFRDTAAALGLGDLWGRVERGYLERSPGGGWHAFYRCDEIRPNTVLAARPGPPDKKGNPTLKPRVETRGEGGYAVVAPSNGKVHETGGRYEMVRGGIATIAVITGAERNALWDLARTFDMRPPVAVPDGPELAPAKRKGIRAPKLRASDGPRPGDDYNERVTWAEVLEEHGWKSVLTRGETTFWRRPGKDESWSATTNHAGSGLLWVFTSSSVFEPHKSYTKFGAYARLRHGGDHSIAAKELRKEGYGGVAEPRASREVPCPPDPPALRVVNGDGRPGRNLTDLGNAERLVDNFGGSLRYCHTWKKWLVWDGRRWAIDESGAARRTAMRTVRSIYGEAGDEDDEARRKLVARHATDSEKRDRMAAMLSLAEPKLPVVAADLDADPWAFNCPNGTIDLRTGRLGPHRPDDLITKLSPVEFNPEAKSPLWDSTLRLFFDGDDALISYFQQICGYALCGVIRDHILPIAYGHGSNGKSTMLGALLNVFGLDYAMKATPDLLMVKKHGHPTERADLFGKRLVVGIETEAGEKINESLVKDLTGGDRIRARRMREDMWEFEPTHTLILATNHKPQIKGIDNGIWRRLRLIPFGVQVETKDADKTIPERLREEYPGILAWCVRGCLDWQRAGELAEPECVTAATNEYRAEQDTIGTFLAETTQANTQARVKAGRLYAAYRRWAEDRNEEVLSQTSFGTFIEERGIRKKISNGKWYLGLHLPEADDDRQTAY